MNWSRWPNFDRQHENFGTLIWAETIENPVKSREES
jgi:hypothetical protein